MKTEAIMKNKQNYPAIVAGIWINAKENPPITGDGWFLVVVEGHGKKRMVVDFYSADDCQWQEEHKDDDVVVTDYRKLPEMPGEESINRSACALMSYANDNSYFGSNSQSQIIEVETLEKFFDDN